MTLIDDLTDIRGIGDAKAMKIMDLVDDHEDDDAADAAVRHLEDALSYYEAGQYGYAEKFLHRAVEALD